MIAAGTSSPKKLYTKLPAEDVTDRLDLVFQASGCDQVNDLHKPRLLRALSVVAPLVGATIGDGSSFVSGDLVERLQDEGMKHSRGVPSLQTQSKIECWHQTLKTCNLPENDFLPGDLETQSKAFIDHYNHQRFQKSLHNVKPADVTSSVTMPFSNNVPPIDCFASNCRSVEKIKQKTLEARRSHHRKHAA